MSRVRVVSMPCREWFDEQDDAYRESVIPAAVKARVSVEAGVSGSWRDIVGDAGRVISINHYGASADGALLFKEFGFTAETVAAAARESLAHVADAGAPLHAAAAGPKNTGDHSPTPAPRSAEHRPRHPSLERRNDHMSEDRLKGLADEGVSIWLDDLSRERLNTGNLEGLIKNSSVGRGHHQPDDLRLGAVERGGVQRPGPRARRA